MKRLLTAIALTVLTLLLVAGCTGSSASERAKINNSMGQPAGSRSPASPQGSGGHASWIDEVSSATTDELWVIVEPDKSAPGADASVPGSGTLAAARGSGFDPLPLASTAVNASISGLYAGVDVHQSFVNPYAEKIEAVYAFPLPQDAAVTGFIMTAGERTIRAVIRERHEAEKIYYAARGAGQNAALLTQERPNIFTQRVANIEPGKSIDIDISYFHAVEQVDGWCEWVFPMTIADRFTPPGKSKSWGPANPTAGATYVTADNTSLHRVSIDLSINAGVTIEELRSTTHTISTREESPGKYRVALDSSAVPDRDFVVRYRVGASETRAGVALANSNAGGAGGYFALTIYPPMTAGGPVQPREMIFLLDRSGSMKGESFRQATAALDYALSQLTPADTFQVISFSNDVTKFADAPVPATREMVSQGRAHVNGLVADGGTMAMLGVEAAFTQRTGVEHKRIIVLLSDGQVSNEAELIGRVHDADDACVFSFGIGSAPNRFLMDRMARMGGGAAAYISNGDDAVEPMRLFLDRVSTPVLTNVKVDYGPLRVDDIVPDAIPDLWLGRPITIVGRTRDGIAAIKPGTVRITGESGGVAHTIEVPVEPQFAAGGESLPYVWARRRIMQLADEATYSPPGQYERDIQRLALDFGLASPFTAFVAVDAMSRTSGGHGTTVVQPQAIPHGTRYETSADR